MLFRSPKGEATRPTDVGDWFRWRRRTKVRSNNGVGDNVHDRRVECTSKDRVLFSKVVEGGRQWISTRRRRQHEPGVRHADDALHVAQASLEHLIPPDLGHVPEAKE